MILSEAEINAIVKAATEGDDHFVPALRAAAIRRMLKGLAEIKFRPGPATALTKLCDAGARYGWREWEASLSHEVRGALSWKAKQSLRNELHRRLARITRPCLELEQTSFELALNALGLGNAGSNPKSTEHLFLRGNPSDRLFKIFQKFPVLAGLWSQLIVQLREPSTELLNRIALDRVALSRNFFDGKPLGRILDLRCGLSDAHHDGRTVTLLQFETGPVIYKPRPGEGEWQWHSLVQWMNDHGFRPRLRAGRVIRRTGYSWMEYVAPAECKNIAAARRFYERIGATIAMAYLLRAVDCHRENIVASGEYPVLVDADALWHVSSVTKTQDALSQLYRTGFFPNADRRSLQSRSSALGPASSGQDLARIGKKALSAVQYQAEIVSGFKKAWHCLLGSETGRKALARRVRQIRSTNRRWLYRATQTYADIRLASIQPAVLRSRVERDLLINRHCARDSATPAVIQAESEALKRLDIPYFIRRTAELMPQESGTTRSDVLMALERALSVIWEK